MGPITITFAAVAMAGGGDTLKAVQGSDKKGSAPPPVPQVVIVPPPAPPPIPKPRPNGPNLAPTPRYGVTASYGSWDYPEAAQREKRGGVTKVEIAVSKWGTVADCRIVSTSGHADLDAAACERLASRAQFWPATDAAGKDTSGTFATTIRWEPTQSAPLVRAAPVAIPPLVMVGESKLYPVGPRAKTYGWARLLEDDWPLGARDAKVSAKVHTVFDIDVSGKVTDCRVAESGGNAVLDARSCAIVRERAEFVPARGLAGEPTASRGEQVFEWRGSEAVRTARSQPWTDYWKQPATLPAFMTRSGKASARMVLGKDGKAQECKVDGSGGLDGIDKMAERMCKEARDRGFRTISSQGEELPREIVVMVEVKASAGKSD